MEHFNLDLPLKNPVMIFSVVLFIILLAPILLNRLKIPSLIGIIIAGALIGPNGLNLLTRDASVVLLGTVGLLYIMFLAGLEIDMADFKRNKYKSILFGLYTFSIPMVLGVVVSYYFLDYALNSSILLASMFASHTLLAYPIASRYGVIKNRAVNITVGGTMITDTLALLVLAVVVGMVKGNVGQEFWIRLSVSLLIFGTIVLLIFPLLSRWFFKHHQDSVAQYIFVLGIMFVSAMLAEIAGVEGIIGAFLAGLAINRLIPHTSALMNRIEFVGNALFIPFFLISVGMLVDFRVLVSGPDALIVAGVMVVVATLAKFLAAYLAKLSFRFTQDEFIIMFGLSNAQAAATLAAVLVGYNIILETLPDGTPVRLLSEEVLNGTIMMILVTCTISSFAVNKAARGIALADAAEDGPDLKGKRVTSKFMISASNEETIEFLINFAVLLKNKKAANEFLALYVRTEEDGSKKGEKLLEKAQKTGAALDTPVKAINRFDLNISNGILYAIKENGVTDVIIGMHERSGFVDTFYGNVLETVITKTKSNLYIYKPRQPLNTIQKLVVVVPPQAEYEIGFVSWVQRLQLLSKEINAEMVFYSSGTTADQLKKVLLTLHHNLVVRFHTMDGLDDFLVISRSLSKDDLLVIVNARRNTLSYDKHLEKLPQQLTKYFNENNVLILFPAQYNEEELERMRLDGSIDELIDDNLSRIDAFGKYVKQMLKGN